ncbi:hypothetical protein [Eubacterium pyruvativorans]|uniref:hypothetical protein n=1 Tax=Eubacterium pyruvativorans TaxID=155865 RepID=UPI0015684EA3|nr:hypothetical protein [Eubacterium pyruvativorans]
MTILQYLTLIGVPAVCAAGIIYLVKKLVALKERDQETEEALRLGVQALLRDRLYQLYRYCKLEKGYAGINDRNNFSNMFNRYESLGGNGVMDTIKDKFMALPTAEEHEERKGIHE